MMCKIHPDLSYFARISIKLHEDNSDSLGAIKTILNKTKKEWIEEINQPLQLQNQDHNSDDENDDENNENEDKQNLKALVTLINQTYKAIITFLISLFILFIYLFYLIIYCYD
jgi:predicted PurR-regulated permease PerM